MITHWGSNGIGNGQFYGPEGIAVDASGNFYVTDNGNDRVQKFKSDGTYLTQWGTHGSGNGQFDIPFSIAVDRAGNVYVTDGGNRRVQKFDSNGKYITQWKPLGVEKWKYNAFFRITTDSIGHVYVAAESTQIFNHGYVDTGSIQKFNSDGSFVTQWGSRGKGNGQFGGPSGIAVDAKGNVYVADVMNNRIQKFKPDGAYITQWGNTSDGSNNPFVAPGNGKGKFNTPMGIAVDASGKVFVVDSGNKRIQVFDSNGKYLTQWDPSGDGIEGFINHPGITADASGHVYVTDTYHNWIQKFEFTQISGTDISGKNSSVIYNPAPTPTVDVKEIYRYEYFNVEFLPNHSKLEKENILNSFGVYLRDPRETNKNSYLIRFTNGMMPEEAIKNLKGNPAVKNVSSILRAAMGGADSGMLIGFKPNVSVEEKKRVLTSVGLVMHTNPRSFLIGVTNGAPWLEELLKLRKDPAVLWTSHHYYPFDVDW